MAKRRNSSAQFKAKVALEALAGDQTMAELAAKHNLHPNVIAQWKRQARESLPEVFARKTSRIAAEQEAEVKTLHAKIGQLAAENDFLVSRLRSLSRDRRQAMIGAHHPRLSVVRQCTLVALSRSTYYYAGRGGKCLQPAGDALPRRAVSGHAVVWVQADDPSPAAPGV